MCSSMNEFYEIANFMNTWSQQQQEELHESFVNRLYECKPVKTNKKNTPCTYVRRKYIYIQFDWTYIDCFFVGGGDLHGLITVV